MEPDRQCHGRQLPCQGHKEVCEAPHTAELRHGQRSHCLVGEQVSDNLSEGLTTLDSNMADSTITPGVPRPPFIALTSGFPPDTMSRTLAGPL
jgi:CRISPR/Cas system-associated protein Csm6